MQTLHLSPSSLRDLQRSGLSHDTLLEAGVLPLTPANFKEWMSYSLIHSSTRQAIISDGYIIPYKMATERFGRVKVLRWNPMHKPPDLPKYIQPPAHLTKHPNHLYYLKIDADKFKSPKTILLITEGEKKNLKLTQEIRKLDTNTVKYAAIATSGVWNWKNAPEWQNIPLKNRKVVIFFDADGMFNPQVAKAEIELFSFLISKGAIVKSAVWDVKAGKGIDDYLVESLDPAQDVQELIQSAISPISKYYETITLEDLLKSLAKYLSEIPADVLDEIKRVYKASKTEVKKKVKEYYLENLMEKQLEAVNFLQKQVQETFNIDYTPKIPELFLFKDGYLLYKDDKLCPIFIVSKAVHAVEKGKGFLLQIRFADGKSFTISHQEMANYKNLNKVFNHNGIVIDEAKSKKIQKYIADFYIENEKEIPISYHAFRTGWHGEEFFIPQLQENCSFEDSIANTVKAEGDKVKEYQIIKQIVENYDAGLFWFISLIPPSLYRTGQRNAVFYTYGESGKGKTLSNKVALSTYGNPEELANTTNFTIVGEELLFYTYTDLPILLDEIETRSNDPKKIALEIPALIYRFCEGKGRTRATTKLSLRETYEWRGILLLTAERSLVSLVYSTREDRLNQGVFRRTIEIPANRLFLWDERIGDLYDVLKSHHGNLIKDWIEYISRDENIDKLKKLAQAYEDYFLDHGFLFRGQEKILSLFYAVIETAGSLFELDVRRYDKVKDILTKHNYDLFSENIENPISRFFSCLEDFISLNVQNFLHPELNESTIRKLYGKITENEVYLTPAGLSKLCTDYKFDEKEIVRRLINEGFIEKGTSTIAKRTTIYYKNSCRSAIKIKLPAIQEQEGIEL